MAKVTFEVKAPVGQPGLYIVGNVSELGLWNPKNALKLTKKKDIYTATVEIEANYIEFKVCRTKNWEHVEKQFNGSEVANRCASAKGTIIVNVEKFA